MTKEEAIKTLSGLRKAFRALNRAKVLPAFHALVNTGGPVVTDAFLALRFSSALNDLAAVFNAIDRKGIPVRLGSLAQNSLSLPPNIGSSHRILDNLR
jgi:hypothetical protein